MSQKQMSIKKKIISEERTYKAGGTTLYGSIHRPEQASAEAKLPALVLFPAFRGRDAFAEDKACSLAEEGFVVLVADPYGEKFPAADDKQAGARMSPLFLNRPLLQERAKAAFDQLCNEKTVEISQIGALGFCFGGLTSLELLRLGTPLKGIVSLHGVLSDQKGSQHAQMGVRAENLSGRSALFLHGNDDPLVSEEDLVALRKELTEKHVEWTLTTYGHTSHAFTNPEATNPAAGLVYNPKIAARAWQATIDFFHILFDKHLDLRS